MLLGTDVAQFAGTAFSGPGYGCHLAQQSLSARGECPVSIGLAQHLKGTSVAH